MTQKFLTRDGLEKLKNEVADLETRGRKEAAEKMRHAISFGDISENAAYDEARESHGLLEAKIADLKSIIASAQVVEKDCQKAIQVGCFVSLLCDGKDLKFQIVGSEEVDVLAGKISYQSPLGKLLLGKQKGDKISLSTPGGKTEYQVVCIK